MMANMKKSYGEDEGKNVYYAVENKMKKQGKLRSMLDKARRHGDTMKA